MTKSHTNSGFTLVEMIMYVAILSFMLVIILTILVTINRSVRQVHSSKSVQTSGILALERITRESRDAQSIITASSTLTNATTSNPGTLVLLNANGTTTKTVEFSVQSGVLHIKENGVDKGGLTQSDARVTSLLFTRITSPHSEAVRTQMTIESGTSTFYRTANFYMTTVLRGSL